MMNKVTLSEVDYTKLSSLAQAVNRGSKPKSAANLTERLRNSLVFKEELITETIVRMNSMATLTEEASGETFAYQLVFPAEADISAGRISVLSPLGAAMLGRREGESFSYDSPDGMIAVRVEKIVHEG